MLRRVLLFVFFAVTLLHGVETVKIGVLAKRSPTITMERWSATAEYLTESIDGYRFEIVPLDFEALFESVAHNEIDFVLTNTMYYVELEYLYGVSRIATLKNLSRSGEVVTSFGGVIFTKKSSGIYNVEDLRGKRFGAVNVNSFGGWVMGRKELADHRVDVDELGELRFFDSHDAVVLAVKNGLVDAGTVRTDTIERMSQEELVDPSVCRVLSPKKYPDFPFKVSTALYPEWPFAKLSSTSDALAERVVIALLQMPRDSQAARDARVAGWTIPLDYSSVHELLEELQIGPYEELGKLTFARIYERYIWWFYGVLFGFMAVISVMLYIYRLNGQLRAGKAEIERLNAGLEHKVEERTHELKELYGHEKYLKDILKTIADVNELLITSFSTQTIVQNSMERLARHRHYRFVWIGLIAENLLEVVGQSKENDEILDQRTYNLADHEQNFAFKSAKSAIELNTTVIEKLPEHYRLEVGRDCYDCSSCWMVTLPLRASEQDAPLGNLSVFSEREDGFEPEEVKMLENLATDIGRSLNAIQQRSMLEAMEIEKISNYEETILAFVNIIEQRDSYTAGHTIRVAEYCRLIAEEMGIEEPRIVTLEKAAILHDIGKVVTPDAILLKPGNLTALEYELIKQHSHAGYRMLSKIDMYKDLAEIIRYHHARYDGKGYPATPAERPEAVPLLSHIMAVADAFDAMTTNRIYKPRKSLEEAIGELKKLKGTQFHPEVADAAVKALSNVSIGETTQLPDNELEQRRFAYFFLDSVTDLYNENYLRTILVKRDDDRRCLHLLELKKFSDYNRQNGWEAGNLFLKRVAETLQERFDDAMVFRYHGDNFILLFPKHHRVTLEEIGGWPIFEGSGVELYLTHYDLKEGMPEL